MRRRCVVPAAASKRKPVIAHCLLACDRLCVVCSLKDDALVFRDIFIAWVECTQALNNAHTCTQLLLMCNIVSRATLPFCSGVARFQLVCHEYAVPCALHTSQRLASDPCELPCHV
jgi:hypothetical protein